MRAIATLVLCLAAWPNGLARAQAAARTAPPAATAPQRVVSANLCADQLLLALVAPQRIVALSSLASDPSLSPVAAEARRHRAIRGSGEEIARLAPDLALIGAYDAPFTRALLKAEHVPVYELAPWRDLKEGRAQIRALADRLGARARGEALVAEIDAALARARGAAGRPATFLTLHRRGYSPGARSVVSEIARAAGLSDIAARVGVENGGFVPLEAVIEARPDFLIVSDLDPAAQDRGQELLLHPALAALYPPEKRLAASDQTTLCAGPATPAAIDALAAEIRAKVRRERPLAAPDGLGGSVGKH